MTAPEIAARYAGTRVLILGATGFLGRTLVAALAGSDAEIHGTTRAGLPSPELPGPVIVPHPVDLLDLGAAARLIARLRPGIVFNLAGYGVDPDEKRTPDPALAWRLNSDLPVAIARAVGAGSGTWVGRCLVHVGSVAEYGPVPGIVTESTVPRPLGLYGETKLSGTIGISRVGQETGIQTMTARVAQVYGPGEHSSRLLPTLIRARQTGTLEPLSVGTQRKDFTFSDDVAEGLLRLGLTTGEPGEQVNLATGSSAPVRAFVLEAAHLLRLPPAILQFERPVASDELSHEGLSVDRLSSLAGWVPTTTIREGIEKTIAVHQLVPNE